MNLLTSSFPGLQHFFFIFAEKAALIHLNHQPAVGNCDGNIFTAYLKISIQLYILGFNSGKGRVVPILFYSKIVSFDSFIDNLDMTCHAIDLHPTPVAVGIFL